MFEPQISVIIPCHNVSKYLGRCIDSIIGQTIGIDQLQIILVNDASEDNTWEIICRYKELYPTQIQAIDLKENLRQGGARNAGLAKAVGTYIAFVDSDDWIEPDMYEKLLVKMTTYQCDITYCRYIRDHDTGASFERKTGMEDRLLVIDSDQKRSEFIVSCPIGVSACDKLYRRDFLTAHELRFIEHKAYEDIHWGALVNLYATRVYMLEERLYHYYVNDASTVLKKDVSYHLDLFDVCQALWQEYIRRGALERYPDAVKYDFLLNYYISGWKILALRFEQVPYDVFYHMQDTVKCLVPDYQNNPYVRQAAGEFYRLLFGLIDQPVSPQEIDEVCRMIRKIGL
jgi:glycosyltransferase involved in cell wall biosynthesis